MSLPRKKTSARYSLEADMGQPEPLGATLTPRGANFALYSQAASAVFVSIFDEDGQKEVARFKLEGPRGNIFFGFIKGVKAGTRYGVRAEGEFDPDQGLYFDPEKLLVDPYARMIDRAYVHDKRLTLGRGQSGDTAKLVPKGIVCASSHDAREPMKISPAGLIYEVNVRSFTRLHPEVPEKKRGTLAALMEPAIVDYFVSLGVGALELMPLAAFIDERHLPELGLHNIWGYNPIGFFAPDPRLMPGGICELRALSDLYRRHDIAIILDVVYNHSGESDRDGAVLSFKGLDAKTYYRHQEVDGRLELVNDTGCGNTLRCNHQIVIDMVLGALRYWLEAGGVSGFRFDLAPILGRNENGFSPDAELLSSIKSDPVISKCCLIVEPWDPGPDGYQLGRFGAPFLEWNDKYRDDVRGFWRGDQYKIGDLATRLAGSSDIFEQTRKTPAAGVNFLAAHDGFTLYDLVSYEHKHNQANGENNRDGHGDNLSWNNGVEGETADREIITLRKNDVRALLATLFFSRGTLMVGQGDELGRSQKGNNNAYAQDNETGWINWENADFELARYVAQLQEFRTNHPAINSNRFLSGIGENGMRDVVWLHPLGHEMDEAGWYQERADVLGMHLIEKADEVLLWFNRGHKAARAHLRSPITGKSWRAALCSCLSGVRVNGAQIMLPERSVVALVPKQD
ncbi:Limit dextrin alpha-1,6-maltotetraose-hydrolase [hydrothermal vent metagenome]|uniref:Limit dextrin alpha-1,6-maltotetraose-hydrolase n=1 Tax=hydrothermal vent metagenome TaxID=652676 RepID=A0A3B0TL24_9ZZZZ